MRRQSQPQVPCVFQTAPDMLSFTPVLTIQSRCGVSLNRVMMEMKVTADNVREWTGWPNIHEYVWEETKGVFFSRIRHKFHEILVKPDSKMSPSIAMLFDVSKDEQRLIHVSFGSWHDQFEGVGSEENDLTLAMEFVKELVSGKAHLVEELDARGRPVWSTIVRENWGNSVIGPLIRGQHKPYRIRKVLFNQPPEEK